MEQELAEVPAEVNVVALHDKALGQYKIKLAQLREELQAGVDDGNSAGAKGLRELVDSVTVRPNRSGGISISIQGKLNALVGAEGFGNLGVVNGGSGGPLPSIPTPTGYTLQAPIVLSASGGVVMLTARGRKPKRNRPILTERL